VSSNALDYSVVGIEIEEIDSAQVSISQPTSNSSSASIRYNIVSPLSLVILTKTAEQYSLTLAHLGRMAADSSHGNTAKTACDTIFKITGNKFDRGMVYKFHDDLSGEVIHEIKTDCTESSYSGMRFPMSDIPLPARKLYIANGVRYIKDVDAEDVPVISKQGVMDLTQIRMRAVAKPHIIYLRNMGVKCSMSLAIIVENELWGLLAFHGYKHSFKPSLHQRIACETISTIVSVRIEAMIKNAQSHRIVKLGESMMSLKPERGVIHNLFDQGEGLLEIVDADTLVGYVQGKCRRRLIVLAS
jgi:light-regulated signal transduction histidine kinase (bacteriophytochrome)